MTPEQKKLFEALTPLQQKVCTNVLSGMSNIDSYKAAGGKAKTKASQEAATSELLSHLKVKAFLDSMKESAVNSAIMSRQEMMETLTRLSRVNLPLKKDGTLELTSLSPEQMEALEQVQIAESGIKAKNYSKLAAMKQLAELAGYNEKQRVELSGTVSTVGYTPEEYAQAEQRLKDMGLD